MTIEQMVKLLGRDRTVLVRHINNAIKEGELRRDVNVQNLHNIQTGRGRPELVYDLDTMISVGYRVKSPEGVRFRRWATRVLREMLLNRLDEVKRIWDKKSWRKIYDITSAIPVFGDAGLQFGTGCALDCPFSGVIDLNRSYICIDGKLWWEGVKGAYKNANK